MGRTLRLVGLGFIVVIFSTLRFWLSSQPHFFKVCDTGSAPRLATSFTLHGNDYSRCPTDRDFYRALASGGSLKKSGGFVFINVGFNKGYNFANWMAFFVPGSSMSGDGWHRSLLGWAQKNDVELKVSCGSCDDCRSASEMYSSNNASAASNPATYEFVGVDMNVENIRLVQGAWELARAEGLLGQASELKLITAAVGAQTGSMRRPRCGLGSELCHIPTDNESGRVEYEGNMTVTTVDAVVDSLPRPADGGDVVVDFLLIDAEGHDPAVLAGARRLLSSGRARCVVFEYHRVGLWARTSLADVVSKLDTFGYSCFLQGQRRLWPVTPSDGCWDDKWDFRDHANVLCVSRQDRDRAWRRALEQFVVLRPGLVAWTEGGQGRNGLGDVGRGGVWGQGQGQGQGQGHNKPFLLKLAHDRQVVRGA